MIKLINRIKKGLSVLILTGVFLLNFSSAVFAQALPKYSTVLPETSVESTADCEVILKEVGTHLDDVIEEVFVKRDIFQLPSRGVKDTDILGCAIKTGGVKMWMIPYFIRYILEFVIGLSGIVAVGGIVYGGYLYLFAGLSEKKEEGKNAILYGVMGFILVLLAFGFVNIVISLVT